MAVALGASPLAAQSFFQSLFGFGSPPASAPRAAPGQPSTFSPYQPPRRYPQSRAGEAESGGGERPGRGRYRTVCVRMCDGFYFPMSQGVNRATLAKDADRCNAGCASEARMFFAEGAESEVDEMTDLTGRVYSKLPNAYLYRKRLIDGCTCKPMPWAGAERARHERYAAAEAAAQEAARAAEAAKQPVAKSSAKTPPTSAPARSAPPAASEPPPERARSVAASVDPRSVIVGRPLRVDEDLTAVMPAEEDSGDAPATADAAAPETPAEVHAAEAAVEPEARREAEPATQQETQREEKPVEKPRRPQRAHQPATPRIVRPPSAAAKSVPAAFSLFGSSSSGQPKYVWPGDAPPRTR